MFLALLSIGTITLALVHKVALANPGIYARITITIVSFKCVFTSVIVLLVLSALNALTHPRCPVFSPSNLNSSMKLLPRLGQDKILNSLNNFIPNVLVLKVSFLKELVHINCAALVTLVLPKPVYNPLESVLANLSGDNCLVSNIFIYESDV